MASIKGGVGKGVFCVFFCILKKLGKKLLLIDLSIDI